jgi:hypothetical protein
MRAFYVALSLVFFLCGFAQAQKVGDLWTDKTGMFVHYGDNANLLLRMEDHRFKMIFLDDSGKVTACPFRRVILRVDRVGRQKDDLNLVLTQEPGAACLVHPRFIKPPYVFRVRMLLYPELEGDAGMVSVPMTPFNM